MTRPFRGIRAGGHAMKAKMQGIPVNGIHRRFDPAEIVFVQWEFKRSASNTIFEQSAYHGVSSEDKTVTICGHKIGHRLVLGKGKMCKICAKIIARNK